jgi:hypothetical protein
MASSILIGLSGLLWNRFLMSCNLACILFQELQSVVGPIERRHLSELERQLSRYAKVVGKELSDRLVYSLSWRRSNSEGQSNQPCFQMCVSELNYSEYFWASSSPVSAVKSRWHSKWMLTGHIVWSSLCCNVVIINVSRLVPVAIAWSNLCYIKTSNLMYWW